MSTVREINDPADLEALGPQWEALLEQTPDATFFHSLPWLLAYWKHFGADKRLRVLVVEDGGRAQGILPLVVRRGRRFEPVRVLAYPLDDWGNYYGPIGPEPRAILEAGLEYVRRTSRNWQFIELGWVDTNVGIEPTEQALARVGLQTMRQVHDNNAIIDLAGFDSLDAYLATRTSNFRRVQRSKEKRLAKRGNVTFVCHRTNPGDGPGADPRWDMYDACMAISQVSWQDRAPRGNTLSKSEDRDFYRECHAVATRLGCVETCLLSVDDQPVAFQYLYHWRGFVTLVRTAYDPAYAHEGAGAVAFARTLANCIAHGDHTYDMGAMGQKDYKSQWLTHTRPTYRYAYFPPTPGALLVRSKRLIERPLRNAMRRWAS